MGALWEIVEWRSDALFGTSLSIDNDDTVGDLVRDSLGALTGAALLVAWARFGWGSVSRIPGVNTHEETSAWGLDEVGRNRRYDAREWRCGS